MKKQKDFFNRTKTTPQEVINEYKRVKKLKNNKLMKYRITIPAIKQEIEAKSQEEAIAIFWDNFDTYNAGWPDTENLIIKKIN